MNVKSYMLMKEEEQVPFKTRLLSHCCEQMEKRMQTASAAMKAAQDAANGEEKSSAGDKYETSRAMGHLDRDMNARQLVKAQQELAELQKINPELVCRTGTIGAMVICAIDMYFIATGLGVVEFEGRKIVVISSAAPLAQLLQGKKTGDEFVLNGNRRLITEIF